MTDVRVVAAVSGHQTLALPVLADGFHLLTLHGVFSSSVKLRGGGESGAGDDRGDSRGDDRGDGRGGGVGDDRGDNGCDARGESRNDIRWGDKGDGRGDSRGDLRGDASGDSRSDLRVNARDDNRGDARGDSRGDNRSDACGDAQGKRYAGAGAPWHWGSRTPAERLWLVADALDARQHRFLVLLQRPQLLHLTVKGDLVLLAQLTFL